jgi:hypothetical protein
MTYNQVGEGEAAKAGADLSHAIPARHIQSPCFVQSVREFAQSLKLSLSQIPLPYRKEVQAWIALNIESS